MKFVSQERRARAQVIRVNLSVKLLNDRWSPAVVHDVKEGIGFLKFIVRTTTKVLYQINENPRAFQFAESILGDLGLSDGRVSGPLRSVGGFFSVNQAFADQPQLNPEKTNLNAADDNQSQREHREPIVRRHPFGFFLTAVILFVVAFWGTGVFCRWRGLPG